MKIELLLTPVNVKQGLVKILEIEGQLIGVFSPSEPDSKVIINLLET